MYRALLTAVFAAILSTGALAADLNSPLNILAGTGVAPATSWTGFYAGVNGGYSFGRWNGSASYDASTSFPGDHTNRAAGFSGGGQMGYNLQSGAIVYGVETDISGGDFNGESGFKNGRFSRDVQDSLGYFGTVRGRVGYAVGNFLPYVTGGFAYGHTSLDSEFLKAALTGSGTTGSTRAGYTLGAGVEWAFSGNWSVKAEWLYTDLGRADYQIGDSSYRPDLTFNAVKVGINYRIGNVYIPLK